MNTWSFWTRTSGTSVKPEFESIGKEIIWLISVTEIRSLKSCFIDVILIKAVNSAENYETLKAIRIISRRAEMKSNDWCSLVDKYIAICFGWYWANEKNVISFALSSFPVWITGVKSRYSRQFSTWIDIQSSILSAILPLEWNEKLRLKNNIYCIEHLFFNEFMNVFSITIVFRVEFP